MLIAFPDFANIKVKKTVTNGKVILQNMRYTLKFHPSTWLRTGKYIHFRFDFFAKMYYIKGLKSSIFIENKKIS